MQEKLQGGNKLSSAMAEFPDVFPVHTVASVWAGEMAGRLEIVLDEVASDLETEASEVRLRKIGWVITKLSVLSSGDFTPPVKGYDRIASGVAKDPEYG